MPYTICVNRPGCLPEASPVAVAEHEDAVEAAHEEIGHQYEGLPLDAEWAAFQDQATDLPEHGGVIGPLENGYVVDVTYHTWLEMLALTPVVLVGQYPTPSEKDLILEAYNGAGS